MSAVTGVAADGSGNLYVAGWTEALDFPIAGAVQASNQGGVDVFVAKVNASGTALVYATYIGGRGEDRATGIAVDSLGQAYVTGSAASTNFPLASPIRSTLGGGRDAFALKLNSAGNTLLYSTYLGGTNYDVGTAIAVDGSGNAYIAGDTLSANFPVLNAVQAALAGGRDAFITKLTPAGAISFSTYLGGGAMTTPAASRWMPTATFTSRAGRSPRTFHWPERSRARMAAARTCSSRNSMPADRRWFTVPILAAAAARLVHRSRGCWSRPTRSLSMRLGPRM